MKKPYNNKIFRNQAQKAWAWCSYIMVIWDPTPFLLFHHFFLQFPSSHLTIKMAAYLLPSLLYCRFKEVNGQKDGVNEETH